jgi:hypothetical protein
MVPGPRLSKDLSLALIGPKPQLYGFGIGPLQDQILQ